MTEQQKRKCVYLHCRSKASFKLETGEPLCMKHFLEWFNSHGSNMTAAERVDDDGLILVTM